jgi:TolB-like protein/Tfp pilus assembly protein PilF
LAARGSDQVPGQGLVMNILSELKRRNVFKVAAAYIIVGWLILQVSDTLVPALHLPEWFHSGVAFILIIGFPLALVFAWAFEMTPEGLKREKDVDPARSMASATGHKLNHVILSVLILALGYMIFDKFVLDPKRDAARLDAAISAEQQTQRDTTAVPEDRLPDRKSIAVIPFQNRSANEENAAFFSDGVHDELLTNLSKIEELKVISRTSVLSYRDTTKNMRQIGEELGVATILEGGVQRAGNTVRINIQLIDATTDEHLWAEVYDRQLTAENIFAIQSEIAHAIAKALEATLSPREHELLSAAPTASLAAYDSFLMASQLINNGNWQSLRDAQSYLKNAIELDPEFVQAHVLLAKTHFDLVNTGAVTLQEVSEPWQKSMQTALSLDPENATAIAVQALYLWSHEMGGVEEAFEKARQLEPHNAEIITAYAVYLSKTFQPDRAVALYEMAIELDPVSINVLLGLARNHMVREEFDQALEMFARIRRVDPTSVTGYGPVTEVFIRTGDVAQAQEWLSRAVAIDPEDSDISNFIAMLYMDLGDYDLARTWLRWIEQNQNLNPLNLSNWAMLNIYEGQLDTAVEYVHRAIKGQMQDRWGSDAAMVRTLLTWALDGDQAADALRLVRQTHPELFNHPPQVNAGNILQAIDTAQLLQNEGLDDDARTLLQAAIAAYEKPYAVTAMWLVPAKAYALALLGEKQAALKELRLQADKGWRIHWRWSTELNPNFTSLRDEPEFHAIIESLRNDMAQQYQHLIARASNGEIQLQPGISSP